MIKAGLENKESSLMTEADIPLQPAAAKPQGSLRTHLGRPLDFLPIRFSRPYKGKSM
jgi:hypothetical protein